MTRRKVPETTCPSCGLTAERFHVLLEAEAREALLERKIAELRVNVESQASALVTVKAREAALRKALALARSMFYGGHPCYPGRAARDFRVYEDHWKEWIEKTDAALAVKEGK